MSNTSVSIRSPKIIKTLGIIPARYLSSRFPGKPLVEIAGKSMINRVWEQARKSKLSEVVVATDDERIFTHVQDFGGTVYLTPSDLPSGTERCAAVAALPQWRFMDIVVNIQGDEPFIQPSQIDAVVDFLKKNKTCPIATLAKKITNPADLDNPNVVKVVFDHKGRALYFSRSPIPHFRNLPLKDWPAEGLAFKHVGLYAFRRKVLAELPKLPPGRLEQAEWLEQLRWLENGLTMGIALTDIETFGIDTPEDLAKLPPELFAGISYEPTNRHQIPTLVS